MNPVIKDAICPECKGDLIKDEEKFSCRKCEINYPLINGIPVLLKNNPLIVLETPVKGLELPLKIKLNFLKPIFSLKFPTATRKNMKYLRSVWKNDDRLLIIGGGIGYRGPFMGELGEELLKNSVNLEIEVGGLVDVVADVHSIPFPSDYFNGVICQTVLEHTVNSEQAVAEIHRVLKPGGIVYVEVPFLQPVHMTSDFRRYTLMGLETLFRDFEKIKSGVNGGIGSAFTMVGVNFFATLLSFNVGFLYRLWRLFFRFVFAPFKFFDLLFSRFNTAPISSSENYFLGRKKSGLL